MGAPIQGKGNRRNNSNNIPQRNGLGKPRPRRPLNCNFPQFFPPMMRPRGPFYPNRPMGMMRPMMGPPNMRPPLPRGVRPPPPPHMARGPMMRPRMMGPGPRLPPPPGRRLPPPGMPLPPPHMMGMRPGPPPPMRGMGFHRGVPMNRRKFPMGPFKGVQQGRIMKKRRSVVRVLDLTKPWVTETIKEEFKKKDEMLAAAKNANSDDKSLWAVYRNQREQCNRMYHTAEMEFLGQPENPQEEYEFDEDYNEEMPDFEEIIFCDVCEEDFYTQESYEKHISEHRICGLDGCKFEAHSDHIEKHIEMQHLTGLYEKIRSVNTPEEIAKWVDERKVRYPTKENIQRGYEQRQEMLKRGEKIGERKNRFGRDKTRLSRVRQKKPIQTKRTVVTKVPQKPKESLIDEQCDWNGTMFPFRGTKELYEQKVDKEASDYEDDEWSTEASNSKVPVKLNNALGALMGAYMSDDEQERQSDNDNEAPLEEKIGREPVEYPNEAPKEEKPIRRSKKRKMVRNKRAAKKPRVDSEVSKRVQSEFPPTKFVKRKVTLLEKLLDSEIRHERNVLLQCVQYVVGNNFFRNKTES